MSSGLLVSFANVIVPVPAAALLRLVAVRVVEAALQRVPARDLRQADRHVIGRVDVEEPGERHVRRRVRSTRLPHAKFGGITTRAVPDRRVDAVERLVGVVARIDHVARPGRGTAGRQAGVDAVRRRRSSGSAVVAEGRPGAGLRQRAACQLVLSCARTCLRGTSSVAQRVVDRGRQRADDRVVLLRVVPAGNRTGDRLLLLLQPEDLNVPRSDDIG